MRESSPNRKKQIDEKGEEEGAERKGKPEKSVRCSSNLSSGEIQ